MSGKKLYRTEGPCATLAGVCGGIAEYFSFDVTLVRVGWAALTVFYGAGFWLYLACAIIVPKKSTIYPGE